MEAFSESIIVLLFCNEDFILKMSFFQTDIFEADKTTVSVATGNVEYHPLYFSIGNIHNTAQHAHGNAVVPIGFLAIPKSTYIH